MMNMHSAKGTRDSGRRGMTVYKVGKFSSLKRESIEVKRDFRTSICRASVCMVEGPRSVGDCRAIAVVTLVLVGASVSLASARVVKGAFLISCSASRRSMITAGGIVISHTGIFRGDVPTRTTNVTQNRTLPKIAPSLSVKDRRSGRWDRTLLESSSSISIISIWSGIISRDLNSQKMRNGRISTVAARAGRTVWAVYDMKEMENAPETTRFVGLDGGRIAEAGNAIKIFPCTRIPAKASLPIFATENCAYIQAVGGTILDTS